MAGFVANPQVNFAPTSLSDWARSDKYHNGFLFTSDDLALDAALENSERHGLPAIAVSRAQGKYLKLLLRTFNAKKVLEIGTLGGYSTIWMAQGIPEDGKLTTLEIDQHHADVALENLKNAGLSHKVEILVGSAAETLDKMHPSFEYDFVFIDADKPSYPIYYHHAKRLLKRGGVIFVDNVVRNGRVADPTYTDHNSEGIRALLEVIKGDREVEATTMGLAGEKGYDGYMYIVKN